ncbi:MAG TPA: GNAT family protein [Ignavibacteria bacterium]|nr:GNAT family protein [Ignavibacteria bacterium]HRF66287.1 GNAT family protein [Ignavibacteria bacterium]HRJ05088.1 GNAT family protein [Ignavibacteria bacterium]
MQKKFAQNMKMPEVLEGSSVKLIPLSMAHAEELWESARDKDLWEHYTFRKMESFEKFKKFLEGSLAEAESGKGFTFTIIDKATGKMRGGTSFLDIQPASRSLEIGRTWLAKDLHGTGFNAECKLLLLTYCFEELKLIRVFFKTDSNNLRSQKAMEKIGAKYEGTLRNHMIREDGTFRHSAYYSIIVSEWEEVKLKLSEQL